MDLGRVRTPEWLAGAAGLVLLASLFLRWYAFEPDEATAWQALSVIDVILFVVGVMALGLTVAAAAQRSFALATGYAPILTLAGIVATLLVLYRIVSVPDLFPGPESRGIGLLLALVGAAGTAGAGWMSMSDESIPRPAGPRSPDDVEVVEPPKHDDDAARTESA